MTKRFSFRLALSALFLAGLGGLAVAQDVDANPNGPVTITPRQGTDPDADSPGRRPIFGPGSDGKIHGEVGAGIGTNGYREAFGTVAIPLGDHAGAVISFDSYRINAPRRGWW